MTENPYALYSTCHKFTVDVDSFPLLEVTFIVPVSPTDVEALAEVAKKIELFLGGEVNLVKGMGKPRCFYCATLNDSENTTCSQCGAPL
jgi:CRISPR/Cas system-associated exonuclease Cas4 (RecB family)